MQELDPPTWLNRMRELGYPPGYLGKMHFFHNFFVSQYFAYDLPKRSSCVLIYGLCLML